MPGDLRTAHPGEARLRAALDAAASGAVTPAWEDIRARVLAAQPHDRALVPVDEVSPPRVTATPSGGRGRAAVAAAAVLVVAMAALGLATRTGGDGEVAEVGASPDATGFYVPVGLPHGWRVTSVVARRADRPRCPGPGEEPARGTRWTRGIAAITFVVGTADLCGAPESTISPGGTDAHLGAPGDGTAVDLGGVDGRLFEAPGRSDLWVAWDVDGTERVLRGTEITGDELVEVARTLVAAGEPATPPEGFIETDRWTQPASPDTTVTVELTAPGGSVLAYDVSQAGSGLFRDLPTAGPLGDDVVGGRDRVGPEVLQLGNPIGPWHALYGIEGEDVDVVVWGLFSYRPDGDRLPTEETVGNTAFLLAQSLRPATVEQWRDLVSEAERSTPVLSDVTSFADLLGRAVPPRTDPSTTVATAPGETAEVPGTSGPR